MEVEVEEVVEHKIILLLLIMALDMVEMVEMGYVF
jgi:hypothetical protein